MNMAYQMGLDTRESTRTMLLQHRSETNKETDDDQDDTPTFVHHGPTPIGFKERNNPNKSKKRIQSNSKKFRQRVHKQKKAMASQ
ncbi:hypothetical protein LINPERHAP1_LOCUS14886, partial [Linum perenne]